MLTVHLFNLKFIAYHGVYPGEAILSNEFVVNVEVNYDEAERNLADINSVINYEVLFDIVRRRMAIPSPLIEEVADTIISKIRHQYFFISSITVSISKLHPPIAHLEGSVGITLKKSYPEE